MVGPGISSGDIHQVAHTIRGVLKKEKASSREDQRTRTFVPVVEGGLNAVGHGMSVVGTRRTQKLNGVENPEELVSQVEL